MKFHNDSKGGYVDKGYPKNIQIFKGGESNIGKFQLKEGSKNPGRNHDLYFACTLYLLVF